jgi:hypothetical protein
MTEVANDFRLDGCIRCTTNRGGVGTYEKRNHMDIWGYTKTFGEIQISDIPIKITNNNAVWKRKIDNITQNAVYDIFVKKPQKLEK